MSRRQGTGMNDVNSERLGREARKHVRLEVRLKANFIIEGDGEQTEYAAVTTNISRGGICLKITEKKEEVLAKLGDAMPRFKVSHDLTEDDNPIDVCTKTTWISSRVGWLLTPTQEDVPILVGMAFNDLPEEDEAKINAFIADLLIQQRESVFKKEKEEILSKIKKIRKS